MSTENRKITRKYYFSADGETEQWYFQWLEKQINNDPGAACRVSFDCKKKNPVKYAKSLNVTQPTVVTHVFDYESHDPVHTTHFIDTLDGMKEAGRFGKKISYRSGYSREHGYTLQNYKGYSYYHENPSLSVWESIAKVLSDCGLEKS